MSAMPNGECNPCRKTVRNSATPSPSASRSKVMRLALGTDDPATVITCFMTHFFKPPPASSSGRGGRFVSATSTSPFGSTYSHRG
jgi:hypothetical protein